MEATLIEQEANRALIREVVSRQMFCPVTKKLLDFRTAILVQFYEGTEFKGAKALHPSLNNVRDKITETIRKYHPQARAEFITYKNPIA